jgi:uncharacterized protein YukE
MSVIVKSTPAAISAVASMHSIIGGGLAEQIAALSRAGDTAGEPANWEGPLADQFRGQWGDTKAGLQKVLADLAELRDQLNRVQANIQAAGGSAI